MADYPRHDRRHDYGELTDRQAENIANLAVRLAIERIYSEVGKQVARKVLFALGTVVTGLVSGIVFLILYGPR